MAGLRKPCPDCGTEASVCVGQVVGRGRLRWGASWACPGCGLRLEEDGADDTPEEARRAILDKEGT
jgi:hypothetical protein